MKEKLQRLEQQTTRNHGIHGAAQLEFMEQQGWNSWSSRGGIHGAAGIKIGFLLIFTKYDKIRK